MRGKAEVMSRPLYDHIWLAAAMLCAVTLVASCQRKPEPVETHVWTARELLALRGQTRDEVRSKLGSPNGFFTRNAEGRWHYSNLLVDEEGAGPPKKMWMVIYFSQFGEQRATLVELHEHTGHVDDD